MGKQIFAYAEIECTKMSWKWAPTNEAMRGWYCRTNDEDCFWLRNLGEGENEEKWRRLWSRGIVRLGGLRTPDRRPLHIFGYDAVGVYHSTFYLHDTSRHTGLHYYSVKSVETHTHRFTHCKNVVTAPAGVTLLWRTPLIDFKSIVRRCTLSPYSDGNVRIGILKITLSRAAFFNYWNFVNELLARSHSVRWFRMFIFLHFYHLLL